MLFGEVLLENNAVTGKKQQELEYTFIGLITDFNQLENASKVEEYEQWWFSTDDSKNKGAISGTIRVRSIDRKKYTMAIKERERSKTAAHSAMETETEISKDMFESFKKLSPLGIIKTRYSFPIQNSPYTWEVDVYTLEDGDTYDWAKIDLEVKKPIADDKFPPPPIDFGEFLNTKEKYAKPFIDKILNRPVIHNRDSILPVQR